MTEHGPAERSAFRLLGLAAWVGLLAAIWLVALPRLAVRPSMARHLEWLSDRRVDPSAMYYTELEVMKPILRRLNDRDRNLRTVPSVSRDSRSEGTGALLGRMNPFSADDDP